MDFWHELDGVSDCQRTIINRLIEKNSNDSKFISKLREKDHDSFTKWFNTSEYDCVENTEHSYIASNENISVAFHMKKKVRLKTCIENGE